MSDGGLAWGIRMVMGQPSNGGGTHVMGWRSGTH